MIFRVSVRSAMWTSDAKALENIAFPEKTVFRQEMTATGFPDRKAQRCSPTPILAGDLTLAYLGGQTCLNLILKTTANSCWSCALRMSLRAPWYGATGRGGPILT